MDNKQNDPAFEAVLRNTGTIDPFIDAFFSFLSRRTDFFVVSPPEGGSIGFPPGVAAQIIISKFKKWQEFTTPPKEKEEDTHLPNLEDVAKTVEVETRNDNSKSSKTETKKPVDKPSPQKTASKVFPNKTEKDLEKSSSNWNSHNGRKSDKYSWSQSIKDLDVHIAVAKTVKTKRDVTVEILPKRIRITTTPSNNEEPEVVDWMLSDPIIKDESYWSLYPGETVFLSLQKVKEKWWDHLFEGEEPIDRNTIESVRPMEDLGDEEQVKIQELVWNQEQKLKGLPTSEETKLHDIMKKAWDVEGSPFKGQPFDPSKVQLATNSGFPPGATPP